MRKFMSGDVVRLEGDIELGDYNVRVCTSCEILENEREGETDIFCRLYEIDGDRDVNTYVPLDDLRRCNAEMFAESSEKESDRNPEEAGPDSSMELPQPIDFSMCSLDSVRIEFFDAFSKNLEDEYFLGSVSVGDVMLDVIASPNGEDFDENRPALKDFALTVRCYYGIQPEEQTISTYSPDEHFPYEEQVLDFPAEIRAPLILNGTEQYFHQWVMDAFKEAISEAPHLMEFASRTDRFWQRKEKAEKSEQNDKLLKDSYEKVRQAATAASCHSSVPVASIQHAFFEGLAKAGREKEAVTPLIAVMAKYHAPLLMMKEVMEQIGASGKAVDSVLSSSFVQSRKEQAPTGR